MPTFFAPEAHEKPLTPEGRARTIAAFDLPQGEPPELSNAEMRRDVLAALMSPSAIRYWRNQRQWLSLDMATPLQRASVNVHCQVSCREPFVRDSHCLAAA